MMLYDELVLWPSCLDCRWRELETSEAFGSYGRKLVTECAKSAVCKRIGGQRTVLELLEGEEGRKHGKR